ncbi:MAG TPA: phosphotransferase [Candidatus Sulfotelmatobacter sp.]|nr:phosphotransferase [Candidatus Sulfotelmatobacter sp.]
MIPDQKRAAVERALRAAFGVTEFDDIRRLTAGLSSALVFRIVVQGCPYLLRLITRTDAMGDPTRQFACMKAGEEAGLAPKIWYTSMEDRVSITDFVTARPFPKAEALVRVPATIRMLHSLPPFPRTVNYLDAMDGFISRFQAAKTLPGSETADAFELYARARAVYPRHEADMVSSHNDLKPENVLFDGERVWLVDWEAGFLNDRYLDLAVVANFVATNDEEEKVLLRGYFGAESSEYQLARLCLMRQILHLSYAAVFLAIDAASKPVDANAKVRGFRDFHDQAWSGEISLAGSDEKVEYARVHLRQALEEMHAPQFEESIRIVRSFHGGEID